MTEMHTYLIAQKNEPERKYPAIAPSMDAIQPEVEPAAEVKPTAKGAIPPNIFEPARTKASANRTAHSAACVLSAPRSLKAPLAGISALISDSR